MFVWLKKNCDNHHMQARKKNCKTIFRDRHKSKEEKFDRIKKKREEKKVALRKLKVVFIHCKGSKEGLKVHTHLLKGKSCYRR